MQEHSRTNQIQLVSTAAEPPIDCTSNLLLGCSTAMPLPYAQHAVSGALRLPSQSGVSTANQVGPQPPAAVVGSLPENVTMLRADHQVGHACCKRQAAYGPWHLCHWCCRGAWRTACCHLEVKDRHSAVQGTCQHTRLVWGQAEVANATARDGVHHLQPATQHTSMRTTPQQASDWGAGKGCSWLLARRQLSCRLLGPCRQFDPATEALHCRWPVPALLCGPR